MVETGEHGSWRGGDGQPHLRHAARYRSRSSHYGGSVHLLSIALDVVGLRLYLFRDELHFETSRTQGC